MNFVHPPGLPSFFFEPSLKQPEFFLHPPPQKKKEKKKERKKERKGNGDTNFGIITYHGQTMNLNYVLTAKCSHELVDLLSDMKPHQLLS